MQIPDSERLSFRLVTPEDSDFLFDLDQDERVMRYINGGKMTSREAINDVYLPRLAQYTNIGKGWGMWMVSQKTEKQPLGWILVRPMDFFSDSPRFNDLELGWRFFHHAWGKGYASEAALQIKTAFICNEGIDFLSAIAMPENTASIKIMEKLGMQFSKRYIHTDPLGDMEVVLYQLKTKTKT